MPQKSFNSGGWRTTGRTRIRNNWLGLAVYEEEREYSDGQRLWAKVQGYRILTDRFDERLK